MSVVTPETAAAIAAAAAAIHGATCEFDLDYCTAEQVHDRAAAEALEAAAPFLAYAAGAADGDRIRDLEAENERLRQAGTAVLANISRNAQNYRAVAERWERALTGEPVAAPAAP